MDEAPSVYQSVRSILPVIRRMIDAGEIYARIDSENSMVRFLEEPEDFASPAMVDRLDQCIRCSVALSERVAAAEHAVRALHSAPYIS